MPKKALKNPKIVTIGSRYKKDIPRFFEGDYDIVKIINGGRVEVEGNVREVIASFGQISVKGNVEVALAEGDEAVICVDGNIGTARGLAGGIIKATGDVTKAYAVNEGLIEVDGKVEESIVAMDGIVAAQLVNSYNEPETGGMVIETSKIPFC